MIYQIFGITIRSYKIVLCKQKNLIPNTVIDKKLNIIIDKAVNTNKKRNTTANK